MIGTVYIHTNKANGMCYVGQTWNLSSRWCKSSYKNCVKFSAALNKYGWDGFDHQIAVQREMTQEEMNGYEQLWIAVLNTTDRNCGYNLALGGLGGGKRSEETCLKQSKLAMGRKNHTTPHSESTKEKLRLANLGRKHSEATKEKLSQIRLGIANSLEHNKNISTGKKGKKISPHKNPRSADHCLQISELKKKWWADRKAAQSSEIQ